VSGGSLGTVFYLKMLPAFPGGSSGFNALTGAESSSLEAVAWGLVVPDLQRAVLPLFAPWGDLNRGWALEQSIALHAGLNNVMLSSLGAGISKGLPAVLLNSTDVEAGGPFVFSNTRFPDVDADPAGNSKSTRSNVSEKLDVRIETAARMSATFPWVSPAARASTARDTDHLADGGYYDNYGITALNQWLREAAGKNRLPQTSTPQVLKRKILLVRIIGIPENAPGTGKPEQWFYQLWAPGLAIYNARGEGQLLRANAELWGLQRTFAGQGIDYSLVDFRFVPCGTQSPPLSWHLRKEETDCVNNAKIDTSPVTQFLHP
jgi:hypothetical protein